MSADTGKPGVVVQTRCAECGITAHWLVHATRNRIDSQILDHDSSFVCDHWGDHHHAADQLFLGEDQERASHGPVDAIRLSPITQPARLSRKSGDGSSLQSEPDRADP